MKNKKICFLIEDEKLTKFKIRLDHDNLNKSQFLRAFIDFYLGRDVAVLSLIQKFKLSIGKHTKAERRAIEKIKTEREKTIRQFGLEEGEVESIFDLIEEEHPDL